jgi:hypothetical protein
MTVISSRVKTDQFLKDPSSTQRLALLTFFYRKLWHASVLGRYVIRYSSGVSVQFRLRKFVFT